MTLRLTATNCSSAARCRSARRAAVQAAKRQRLQKALCLPTHAATIRDLSTALKVLQGLERIAWNLNDKRAGDGWDYEAELAALKKPA